jgi:hypothetical protein
MFYRSVPYNLRSYALGFQWLIMSALGSMPGPVLFGAFIDKTCNLWEERCNETGACLEYDNAQLSYLILAAGLLFQGKNRISLASNDHPPNLCRLNYYVRRPSSIRTIYNILLSA